MNLWSPLSCWKHSTKIFYDNNVRVLFVFFIIIFFLVIFSVSAKNDDRHTREERENKSTTNIKHLSCASFGGLIDWKVTSHKCDVVEFFSHSTSIAFIRHETSKQQSFCNEKKTQFDHALTLCNFIYFHVLNSSFRL